MGFSQTDPGNLKRQKAESLAIAKDSQVNLLATAALAVPGAGKRNSILKVEASYSAAATLGLLQIKSGAAVVFEKYINGAGSVEFDAEFGFPAANQNEAMSAELAAGGAGVTGKVSVLGFSVKE